MELHQLADPNSYRLFDISIFSFNLFSFMLGVTWAFFKQSVFGKHIGGAIFLYFGALAALYALKYYMVINPEIAKFTLG